MTTLPKRAPRQGFVGANWEAQRPRRGRPRATRPRKATRVYLTKRQRSRWMDLTQLLAGVGSARIDTADLAVRHLEQEMLDIGRGLTGDQILPVGVVDLPSLYFLMDLRPPGKATDQFTITMYTETREKLAVLTVRLQSIFDGPRSATWSRVFGLAIELLYERLAQGRRRPALANGVDSPEALEADLFQPRQLVFGSRED